MTSPADWTPHPAAQSAHAILARDLRAWTERCAFLFGHAWPRSRPPRCQREPSALLPQHSRWPGPTTHPRTAMRGWGRRRRLRQHRAVDRPV